MKILITGTAGFIGHHLALKMAGMGFDVLGLDCINSYYDPNIKLDRLKVQGIKTEEIEYNKILKGNEGIRFIKLDLADKDALFKLFESEKFDFVINLAAQAGVRYSLTNPQAYIDSNIQGFMNILEACRTYPVKHLVYASSSSVYGLNKDMPFSVKHNVDHPISLYAASKKSNELMAHVYSQLFNIPTTGLRFFTVYGPWGRPDMALFIFTKAIVNNEPIDVYNYGNMLRDFTYVDDIVESISRLVVKPTQSKPELADKNLPPNQSSAPYQIFNIGNNDPVKLTDFVEEIEKKLGKKAIINKKPLQVGDVPNTYADVKDLMEYIDFKPQTSIHKGVSEFIDWYKKYYSVPNTID
ncbi:MAG: NAD-dependent epimerase [Flavobacteriales bacterium]|nr:NAD-dependent epimerase [Flavobacteriales bacterium]